MLKYETSEVPSGMENLYEATTTGTFRLKVEGAVSLSLFDAEKTRLKEFRDTNITLKKQVEDLATFETMFKSGDFSQESLTAKIEAEALRRAADMKSALELQVSEKDTALQASNRLLTGLVLGNAVQAAALRNGVSEGALEDVLARAKAAFRVVGGAVQLVDDKLDAKGKVPTVDTWMEALALAAPHLFTASRGADARKPGNAKGETARTTNEKIAAGFAQRFPGGIQSARK